MSTVQYAGNTVFKAGSPDSKPNLRKFFFLTNTDPASAEVLINVGGGGGQIPVQAGEHYAPAGNTNGEITVTTTGEFVVHTNLHNV